MESNDRLSAEFSQTVSEGSTVASDTFRMPPYWHEDGDIILLVEEDDTTKRRDFRIHRLMLCLHSPVFRDMFSLGVNVVKENEISTVPIKGDSIKDVQELLKILYKG